MMIVVLTNLFIYFLLFNFFYRFFFQGL